MTALLRLGAAALLIGCVAPAAASPGCTALRELMLPHTQIMLAEAVAAGSFKAPDRTVQDVPAFCRVHAVARPAAGSEIHFEIWLPASGWNGRYRQYAEGGTGGVINYKRLAEYLRSGAAAGTTDDGHSGGGRSGWAFGHPERIIDWGNRAQAETATSAKMLIRRFYGRPPRFSYLAGCSGGGRAAMKAAQRYPKLFDGILAGAPTIGGARIMAWRGYNARLWLQNPAGRIPAAKLPAIKRAALAACTPKARLIEGIAGDPRQCRPDPAALLCKGADSSDCLTAPQVETLRAAYAGPRDPATGAQIYPGVTPGAESTAIFGNWTGTAEATPPAHLEQVQGAYRDFAQLGPSWDAAGFDPSRDFLLFENAPIGTARLGPIYAADDPDLSAFRRHGGKLIAYFGWLDSLDTADYIRRYYDRVAAHLGGIAQTQRFFRLYLVPGMDHCGGGVGANAFGQVNVPGLSDDRAHNIVRALESWVEQGIAPARITAAKFVEDKPEKGAAFTRPLCVHPTMPSYRGKGDRNAAASFLCRR